MAETKALVGKGDAASSRGGKFGSKEARKKALMDRMANALLGKSIPEHNRLKSRAAVAGRRGQLIEAKKLYIEAIVAHGEDDVSLFAAECYNDLGCLLCRTGQVKDSIIFLRLSVEKGGQAVGETDRKVACFTKNLAFAYKSARQMRKACKYYEDAMGKYSTISDSANAGEAAYELATLLNEEKNFSKAEPVARECLEFKKKVADESQIQVVPALYLLAAIISAPEIAKFDEALELATSALKLTKATRLM